MSAELPLHGAPHVAVVFYQQDRGGHSSSAHGATSRKCGRGQRSAIADRSSFARYASVVSEAADQRPTFLDTGRALRPSRDVMLASMHDFGRDRERATRRVCYGITGDQLEENARIVIESAYELINVSVKRWKNA
jgi:hypothetical protein